MTLRCKYTIFIYCLVAQSQHELSRFTISSGAKPLKWEKQLKCQRHLIIKYVLCVVYAQIVELQTRSHIVNNLVRLGYRSWNMDHIAEKGCGEILAESIISSVGHMAKNHSIATISYFAYGSSSIGLTRKGERFSVGKWASFLSASIFCYSFRRSQGSLSSTNAVGGRTLSPSERCYNAK